MMMMMRMAAGDRGDDARTRWRWGVGDVVRRLLQPRRLHVEVRRRLQRQQEGRRPHSHLSRLLLHFARVVDDAKCMFVTHVCLCVGVRPSPHAHATSRTRMQLWGMVGVPLVVHCWVDLQSVHGFCWYDNTDRTRNVIECLYSLYAWFPISTQRIVGLDKKQTCNFRFV